MKFLVAVIQITLGIVLVMLVNIIPIALWFASFYFGHYLRYANPWDKHEKPGAISGQVANCLLSLPVMLAELIFVISAKDMFKGMYKMEPKTSALTVMIGLFLVLAVTAFFAFIATLTHGYS